MSFSADSTTVPSSASPTLSPNAVFIVSTIAGTGTGSYSGDNGEATSAALNTPTGLALDSSGIHSPPDKYVLVVTYFGYRQRVRR